MNNTKALSFLEDNSGGFSATRLAFLLWAIGVLAVWIWCSFKNCELQPIDESVRWILGILMTGKVVQRFGEKGDASNGDSTPPGGKAANAIQTILPH